MTEVALIDNDTHAPGSAVLVSQESAPMRMLEQAVARGASLEQIAQLMTLMERHDANEARKAYHQAMAAFRGENVVVDKDKGVGYTSKRTGDDTSYRHATLGNGAEKLGPALAKHGLNYSWTPSQDAHGIAVTCTLTHRLGHSESVTLKAGADTSGKKNSIQAIASTVSYLERYTLFAITGTATKDMDDDGRGSETDTSPEREALLERLHAAALLGLDAYRDAWKAASAAELKMVGDEAHQRNKETAARVTEQAEGLISKPRPETQVIDGALVDTATGEILDPPAKPQAPSLLTRLNTALAGCTSIDAVNDFLDNLRTMNSQGEIPGPMHADLVARSRTKVREIKGGVSHA